MRARVDEQKNVQAERCGESADDPARNRDRKKDETERFEPAHVRLLLTRRSSQIYRSC